MLANFLPCDSALPFLGAQPPRRQKPSKVSHSRGGFVRKE
jgi:hypothetical protein